MKRNVFLTASLLALMGLLFAACDTGSTGSSRPEITITTQPAAMTTVTEGRITGSLSVEASVTEDAMLSYQWFRNTSASNVGGTSVPTATSASFALPPGLTEGTHFFFVEVRASGGAAPVRSTVAEVTVSAPGTSEITIITQPAALTTVAEGSITGSLSVEASVTEEAILSYQWFETNQNSNEHGLPVTSATNASFAIPTDLTEGQRFFFVEVRASGGAAPVRSMVAAVTVSAPGTPVITVTTQPAALTTVAEGSITGSLSVEASVTEGAILSYQWFINTSASVVGGSELPGMTGTSFEIPPTLTAGTHFFFVEVRASGGAAPVRSTVAVVVVTAPEITITTQPAALTTVPVGSITGSLTVVASVTEGATLSYQWFSNTSASVVGGSELPGMTEPSFDIPTTLTTGTHFFFVEVRASGGAAPVRSIVATVTVTVPAITITTQPAPAINVPAGNIRGSLSVEASVTQGATLSYQWFSNTIASNVGGSELPGMTEPSFDIPTTLPAGTHFFYVEVRASGGAAPIRSNVAVVVVVTPVITITTQPAVMTTVTEGSITGSLSVVATSITEGAILSYQWFSNTIASNVGGSELPGMTEPSFDIPTTLTAGTHFFYVEVQANGGAASDRSTVATVGVIPPLVEMVRVQGGSFERGRELGIGSLWGDTTPVYTITISAFYIGRYQVTREQWTTVMAGNTNNIPAANSEWNTAPANAQETAAAFNENRRPVTHVSWYDAIVFSNRLSIQRGLTPAYELPNVWPNPTHWSSNPDTWGIVPTVRDERWDNVRIVPGSTGYRLPTEAQWEFAAKGGNLPGAFTFAGSNNAAEVGWFSPNSATGSPPFMLRSPRMVGLLPANSLGLHDMTGNVAEWVRDWWGEYTATPTTDPLGAPSGSYRIRRGGDFMSSDFHVRSVSRGGGTILYGRWSNTGLRVARP